MRMVRAGRADETDAIRIGKWLFRQRSYLPIAIILAIAFVHWNEIEDHWIFYAGGGLIVFGEALRLWGVAYAGVITRTRGRKLDRLVTNGPFAYVRNPLYIGNFLLWTGFAVTGELLWLVPIVWLWFIVQYSLIVRWEESILAEEFGRAYLDYRAEVPRWFPRLSPYPHHSPHIPRLWAAVVSERGTFLTILVMILAVLAKEVLPEIELPHILS